MPSITGPPRLDPVERLRHRLYEPLTLLWTINPARDSSSTLPNPTQRQNEFTTLWTGFLDALSCFCDYHHGGRTVSSVAVQDSDSGYCFWLASKNDNAMPHLQWILDTLATVSETSEAEDAILVSQIADASIRFSKAKVNYYRKEVTKAIGTAVKSVLPAILTQERLEFLLDLDDILEQTDPLELCRAALRLQTDRELHQLVRKTTGIRTTSVWSPVRHNLNRLCSWHRKSFAVVAFARQFPQILENYTCACLPLPADTRMPPSDTKTNLLSALKRMLPQYKQAQAIQLYHSISGLRGFDLETAFEEDYKKETLSLAVHAEVYLLEYFYQNELRFVEGCRYIGCSKPSCYCCSLYMRFHPGHPVLRASHGTAWVTWCPPLMSEPQSEAVSKHNLILMNQVIQYLREDVIIEIENRLPRRRRLPDSTSGQATLSHRD